MIIQKRLCFRTIIKLIYMLMVSFLGKLRQYSSNFLAQLIRWSWTWKWNWNDGLFPVINTASTIFSIYQESVHIWQSIYSWVYENGVIMRKRFFVSSKPYFDFTTPDVLNINISPSDKTKPLKVILKESWGKSIDIPLNI